MNRFQYLHQTRINSATKPFNARGKGVKRCKNCQVAIQNCICHLKVTNHCNAAFLVILHDSEILKPSNTGRLIEDVCANTFPFIWSRTQPQDELIALLNDPRWFPMLVFPQQYANSEQTVYTDKVALPDNKQPLFVLLDGSWREARRMFRKSPYLTKLPIVTLPDNNQAQLSDSRYALRSAQVNNHLATAEIAAKILKQQGESSSGELLDLWFDVFSWQYQKSVCQPSVGDENAVMKYQQFIGEKGLNYDDK